MVKQSPRMTDRELIERHVERVIIKSQAVEVHLVPPSERCGRRVQQRLAPAVQPPTKITLPWAAPSFAAVKGIVHAPSAKRHDETGKPGCAADRHSQGPLDGSTTSGSAALPPSPEIAEREGQGERHIRLLAPLAFVSPRIIAAIADGTAPADLTVTGLAKALPYSWAEQERTILQNTQQGSANPGR